MARGADRDQPQTLPVVDSWRRPRISDSRYLRWPPRVRMDESFPAFAHLVTVLGSTRNIAATSAGVRSLSPSSVAFFKHASSPWRAGLFGIGANCGRIKPPRT